MSSLWYKTAQDCHSSSSDGPATDLNSPALSRASPSPYPCNGTGVAVHHRDSDTPTEQPAKVVPHTNEKFDNQVDASTDIKLALKKLKACRISSPIPRASKKKVITPPNRRIIAQYHHVPGGESFYTIEGQIVFSLAADSETDDSTDSCD